MVRRLRVGDLRRKETTVTVRAQALTSHKEDVMRIDEEIRGGVVVLTVSGTVRCRMEVEPLHEYVRWLAGEGYNRVLIDYSSVKWFGSAMLGILTASLSTLRRAGGDLRLAGLSEKNRRVLRVTHLDRVFVVLPSVEEGVRTFGETRRLASRHVPGSELGVAAPGMAPQHA